MSSISGFWSERSLSSLRPEDRKARDSQSTRLTASQTQSTDLTIQTADGDRVTISTNSALAVNVQTYGPSGKAAVGSSGRSFTLQASRATSVSVEGELDRKELKDIKKVVQSVRKMEKDLRLGQVYQATIAAQKFTKLDTVSGINATFHLEQSVSVARQSADPADSQDDLSAGPNRNTI